MGSEERVQLSSFKYERPVALIFGSYTCPPFRAQVEHMERLYNHYQDRMEFFVVYVQEAHPTDGWQVDSNVEDSVLYRQHQSIDEREEAAQSCTIGLHISIPTLVE